MNKRLVGVAVVAAIAAAAIAFYIGGHPYIPEDATIEQDVQATNWGPLTLTFPIFSFIGDAKGAVLEAIIFMLILSVRWISVRAFAAEDSAPSREASLAPDAGHRLPT
jgi:hypothetical protein